MDLFAISRELSVAADALVFGPPVAYVYDPLTYARAPHEAYLRRWGHGPKAVVLLGMNPGPFGMAQTGVPFGEVAAVRDFLGIETPVGAPPAAHPKRPVEGFACRRSEVSGARLWGWVRARFGAAEAFFADCFVANYCPLVFVEAGGRNRTPDKLPRAEREPLFEACDRALVQLVEATEARAVVGIGRFAETRAREALAGRAVTVSGMLHPSPASPAANQGWAAAADASLDAAFASAGLRAWSRRSARSG